MSSKAAMNYWVVKGNPRENNWNAMLLPGTTDQWHTKRLPRRLAVGDRVYFWESAPKLRMIALGMIVRPHEGKSRDGQSLYRVRYLTRRIKSMPTIAELRRVPGLNEASFLKAGPATCLFPLNETQATILFRVLTKQNPGLRQVWPDLDGELSVPVSDAPTDVDMSAMEGNPRLVQHLRRERSQALVRRKKSQTMAATGQLRCECCGFNFAEFYGELGDDFCEVHHRRRLSSVSRQRQTSLTVLAIICSNCHRVIHRTNPMWETSKLARFLQRRTKCIKPVEARSSGR